MFPIDYLPLSVLGFKEIIDILIVSLFIYLILIFIKQSRSFVAVYISLAYLILTYFATVWNLVLTQQIFRLLATIFLLVFVVVFQREFRRFFDWIFVSSRKLVRGKKKVFAPSKEISSVITRVVQELANKKIGALIVFPGELPLDGIIEGGFNLDGRISPALLFSIFDTSSPGHDGAVIIDNNRVRKFGVHLPLAEKYENFNRTGTRHRAAAGLTERSDALAIVVSEERGEISIAKSGRLDLIKEVHELEDRLSHFIVESQEPQFDHFWHSFIVDNWHLKVLAVVISLGLWLLLVF